MPGGGAAAKISPFLTTGHFASRSLAGVTWPAADIPAKRLASLLLSGLDVATNGSVPAVEQARTVLENAYPTGVGSPYTLGEDSTAQNTADNAYQQLADVVILTSLAIADCTLAASVAGGLADRKRPFSLLRLTGARLGTLRRVVVLESAVPLLAVAAVAIGTGFGASAMFTTVQLAHPLAAPDAAHYVMTAAGIVASLGYRGHVPAAQADYRPRDGQKRMIPGDLSRPLRRRRFSPLRRVATGRARRYGPVCEVVSWPGTVAC